MIRKIPWAPNYGADEDGNIWSLRYRRKLKTWGNSRGRQVTEIRVLKEKVKLNVARAVCYTFHGPPRKEEECHHIDGNPQNNRSSNLRWVNRSEHYSLHAYRDRCPTCGHQIKTKPASP